MKRLSIIKDSISISKDDIKDKDYDKFQALMKKQLAKKNSNLQLEDYFPVYQYEDPGTKKILKFVIDSKKVYDDFKRDLRFIKNTSVKISLIEKNEFAPLLEFERVGYEPHKETFDLDKKDENIRKLIEEYHDNIEKYLKDRKAPLKEKKEEMIKKANEIIKGNVYLSNYFEHKLYEEVKNRLNVELKFKQDKNVTEPFECCLCKQKDILKYTCLISQKNNVDYSICSKCEKVLAEYFPHNFSKMREIPQTS